MLAPIKGISFLHAVQGNLILSLGLVISFLLFFFFCPGKCSESEQQSSFSSVHSFIYSVYASLTLAHSLHALCFLASIRAPNALACAQVQTHFSRQFLPIKGRLVGAAFEFYFSTRANSTRESREQKRE